MIQEKPDIMNIDSLLNHLVLIEAVKKETTNYGEQVAIYGKFLLYDKHIKIFTSAKYVLETLRKVYKDLPVIGSFYKRTSKQGYDYYILDTPVVLNKQANDITFEEIQKYRR